MLPDDLRQRLLPPQPQTPMTGSGTGPTAPPDDAPQATYRPPGSIMTLANEALQQDPIGPLRRRLDGLGRRRL